MIIGITGISGSGKTTAAKAWAARYGAEHLDVDAIGHQVLAENNIVRRAARLLFGSTERPIISRQVFASGWKLFLWSAIIQPFMRRIILKKLRNPTKSFVLDAALLHQMRLDRYCDKVIFIDAPEERLRARLEAKGLSSAQILRRLAVNQKVYVYKPRADVQIVNNGSLAALQKNIEKIYPLP
ncbi:dephospho-CoA kinase [Candidatus Termititenax persephonae]|uniref:Dephospho-CoA kinase n=1 Tax=Candidatus Termititenax persephonae TaxID=2218525 RepID=A0A388TJ00_9BACT|nr:dephospho-CoA kinase [Candidatus Termititenax persephonae]